MTTKLRDGGFMRRTAFAGALVLGIAGDLLLRVQGQPALNVLLWAVCGSMLLIVRRRMRGDALRGEVLLLLGVAVVLAACMVWRATEALTLMNLLLAAALVTLAASRGGTPWLRTAGVSEWLYGAVRVGLSMAAGPFRWIDSSTSNDARLPAAGSADSDASPSVLGARLRLALRGTVLALPALLVFSALLMSADPVFERVLGDVFDISNVLPHVLFTCVLAWLTVGYLRAFDAPPSNGFDSVRSPGLAAGEVALAMGFVNVLFLLFVIVQVRYLFGGSTMVEVTPGLSYAEYARRGFVELVFVAALVIPLQLLADWAAADADRADDRSRRVLRGTAVAQLILLGGILASAAQRMHLYQDAYGLTELRLYVSLFMLWVMFVLVWLAITVWRGTRRRFAAGALVSALACALALNVLNPQALIVRTNVQRAVSGLPYDPAYAGSLDADAVPTLVRLLPRLAIGDRCVIEKRLQRWTKPATGDWRNWNYGEWRARHAVTDVAWSACPSAPTSGS